MKNNDLHIEKLYQKSFSSYEPEVSEKSWGKIRKRLLLALFFQFNYNRINIYYVVAAIVCLLFFTELSSFNEPATTYTHKIDTNQLVKTTQKDSSYITVSEQDKTNLLVFNSNKKQKKTLQKQEIETNYIERIIPDVVSESFDTLKPKVIKLQKPAVDFTPNVTGGCCPLTVRFENFTKNADSYKWKFDDGQFSQKKKVTHTYEQPGTYQVELRAYNKSGMKIKRDVIISVYETPEAGIRMTNYHEIYCNTPIVFENSSVDAVFFEWNLGDGIISEKKNPSHIYTKPGIFDIILKVWTEHACFDSAVIQQVKVVEPVLFPNAFTPNLDGSNGGNFTVGDRENSVFHPTFSIEVSDYELSIYTRNGEKIFVSTSTQIGWDGYYNNRLAKQEVYLWVAKGRYKNGSLFYKTGDLVLIYKK